MTSKVAGCRVLKRKHTFLEHKSLGKADIKSQLLLGIRRILEGTSTIL